MTDFAYIPTARELTLPCPDPVKAGLIREYVRIVRSTGGRTTSKPARTEVRRKKQCSECGMFNGYHDTRCSEAPPEFSNYQE